MGKNLSMKRGNRRGNAEETALRMNIAEAAVFMENAPNHPYHVNWEGISFYGRSPRDIVDQVMKWLKT